MPQCNTCGYYHPLPVNEGCPNKNLLEKVSTEKGNKIQKICFEIANFLDSRDDYEKIIDGLKVFMGNMKNK